MTDYSHDPPMQALIAAIEAASAAGTPPATPVVQGQGSPYLRWDEPARAMAHGL